MFLCNWKMGAIREMGGEFVRSFPPPFSPCLPTSTCFHVPKIFRKENEHLSMTSLFLRQVNRQPKVRPSRKCQK